MCGAEKAEKAFPSRSVVAFQITLISERQWFVEKDPIGYAISQGSSHLLRIVGKARSRIAIWPAPGIFQNLRQIPMIERDERPDSGFQQGVHEAAVVINAFGIRRASAGGLDARPRNRKAVTVQIHRAQQRNIFLPAMIGIASYIARVAILDFARGMREAVPDRFALAVCLPRAFDLIGGSSRAPEKIPGEWNLGGSIELRPVRTANLAQRSKCAPHLRRRCMPKKLLLAARLPRRWRGPSAQIRGGYGAK